MVVEMDYAGVGTVVLQNDHIYGNLAEYFAEAARRWPGRFVGLAQVDEPFGYRDEELRALEDQVRRLGMRGLYFTMTAFFRNGYRILPDEPAFDPLWQAVARLDLPVFWVHSAKSPAGDYLDEMRRLRRIVDRHPAIRHVLVHGVPTGLYADEGDRIVWPEAIVELLDRRPVWTEVLYPIAWGGRMPYPYARAQHHFRQTYERFGAGSSSGARTCRTSAATAPTARRSGTCGTTRTSCPSGTAAGSSGRTRWSCSRRPARAEPGPLRP